MKSDPPSVLELAPFTDIAQNFLTHRFNYLYVVDEAQRFKGVVSLHDVKNYLSDPDLANIVIARDIVQDAFPTIRPDASLAEALEDFSRQPCERLPVTSAEQRLIGSVSKTDLLLALTERAKHEQEEIAPSEPVLTGL